MSERVFFRWIELEGIRGFFERQRFELDSSVIIVSGPNGTGKTSFFDALQWLLLGELGRLEAWRQRKNTEHIVNGYQADTGGVASVTAGITLPSGNEVELRRVGRHNKSQLEWRSGPDVLFDADASRALAQALVPTGRLGLRESLLSSGLLQQDEMRDVLHEPAARRYQQFASMLGLTEIADFPLAARKRHARMTKEKADAHDALRQATERVRASQNELLVIQEAVRQRPRQSVRARVFTEIEAYAPVVKLPTLRATSGQALESLRTTVAEVGGQLATLDVNYRSPSVVDDLDVAHRTLDDLRRQHEDAAKKMSLARERMTEVSSSLASAREASSRWNELAFLSMPLLGETCPVCAQEIDPASVRSHLEHLVSSDTPDLVRLGAEQDEAQQSLRAADALLAEVTRRVRECEGSIAAAQTAELERREWIGDVQQVAASIVPDIDLQQIDRISIGDVAAIRAALRALRQIWQLLGEAAGPPEISGPARASLGSESRAAAAIADETLAQEKFDRAVAAEAEAKELQRAAVRAVAAVSANRFSALRPVLQDIYSRLDPHPAFRDVNFAVSVYREEGRVLTEVSDPIEGLIADPLIVFSSAQGNVVALSAFLALALSVGEDALPFMCLDDPLQSMDDVNALGFADLCRHIRQGRQLVISTHDPRLASLLARKLAPRKPGETARSIRFIAWSRSGPIVDQNEIPGQLEQGVRRALVPR